MNERNSSLDFGDDIEDLLEMGPEDLEDEEGTPTGEGEEEAPPTAEPEPEGEAPPDGEGEGESETPTGEVETPPKGEGEEEPPKEDDKDSIIENLRKTVNELSGGRIHVEEGGHATTQEPAQKPTETTPETPTPQPTGGELKLDPVTFIGENDNLDDILEDPDAFNKILNKVAEVVLNNAINPLQQRVLQNVPVVVNEYSKRRQAVQGLVNEFYKNNDDLLPYKKAVAVAANTVHSENPDWDHEKVFNEAAERTRKSLGLKKQVKTGKDNPASDTGLRKRKGGRAQPTLSGIAKDISDLEDL